MNLKEFTTEELRAEIKRREQEARRERPKGRSHKAKYAYAKATITWVSDMPYRRRSFRGVIDKADLANMSHGVQIRNKNEIWLFLLRGNFNNTTTPKLGDTVLLRSRITNRNPEGFGLFSTPYICEVIKRNDDDDSN